MIREFNFKFVEFDFFVNLANRPIFSFLLSFERKLIRGREKYRFFLPLPRAVSTLGCSHLHFFQKGSEVIKLSLDQGVGKMVSIKMSPCLQKMSVNMLRYDE